MGHPDLPHYPIVDPRSVVTPYLDGWSVDAWVVSNLNGTVYPCEAGILREAGLRLVIDAGIFPEWLENDGQLSFGPIPVPGAQVTARLRPSTVAVLCDLGRRSAQIDMQLVIPG